jgi:pimeloyl-ACP methyl ester carboxylesterase
MTTDWTFGGLWRFEPRWFETSDGLMRYVDEGPRDGRPVVLVHGNPTWGFLYRNFIGPLRLFRTPGVGLRADRAPAGQLPRRH